MAKASVLASLLLAFITVFVQAETLPAGVFKLDVKHKHVSRPNFRSGAQKRQSTLPVSISLNDQWVSKGGYFIEVDIGTPPQKIEVLLDTGSANLYVASSTAPNCKRYRCPGGSFSAADSSTYKPVKEPVALAPYPFRIAYGDGSTVNGSYAKDTVRVGKATLKNAIFAIAAGIDVTPGQPINGAQYGIMGVSFDATEQSVCADAGTNGTCHVNYTTPTIPDYLYSAGYIKSRSYSLYLDDVATGKGSILFGGIDKSKFVGDLVTLGIPRYNAPGYFQNGDFVYLDTYLTSVSGTFGGKTTSYTPKNSNYSSQVTLDSGATTVSLPKPIFNALYQNTPGFVFQQSWVINCDEVPKDAYITFGLRGSNGAQTTIDAPFSNFITPLFQGTYNSTKPYVVQGKAICQVGISPGEQSGNLVGDPFLRSAYVYYNLDERTLSMAQASYDSTGSSIMPVGHGPVPSVSGSAKPQSTQPATNPLGNSGSTSSGGSSQGMAVPSKVDGPLLWTLIAGVVMLVGYPM